MMKLLENDNKMPEFVFAVDNISQHHCSMFVLKFKNKLKLRFQIFYSEKLFFFLSNDAAG